MKKSLLSLLIAGTLILLPGCKAIYLSEMSPQTRFGKTLLPALQPMVDVQSLENVFGISSTSTSSHGFATGHQVGPTAMVLGSSFSTSTTSRHGSINDIKVIFENDVRNNICEKYGTNKGYITCSALSGSSGKPIGMWWLGACPGLGVPYLFGMPARAAKTFLQIQVNIYDQQQNLVGSYQSPYYGDKEYVALYWGYSGSNAISKTAMDTFKMCMDNIKQQIANDTERLVGLLK